MVKQDWHKYLTWIRLVFSIIALAFISFCVGLIFYGSMSTSNDIALGFLAGLTAIFALGQWFYSFSSASSEQYDMYRIVHANELSRDRFKMGGKAAATFHFIHKPIQDFYSDAEDALLGVSTGASDKHGILILGDANSGKSRLAFEILIHLLPHWPVQILRPSAVMGKVPEEKTQLVIFIDDLQDYIANDLYITSLLTFLDTLRQEVQRVVVVATCRTGDKEQVQARMGQLFTELEVLTLPRFSSDKNDCEATQIIAEFQSHGSTHVEDWDGTLGSLVLGLPKKNDEYLDLNKMSTSAVLVLQAMKLLKIANIPRHTEKRLRAVCADIFGRVALRTDDERWQEAVNVLTRKQFVFEELDEVSREVILVIHKDSYFEKVITDYPIPDRPHQLKQHLLKLQDVLVAQQDSIALINLGEAFSELEQYEEALDTYEKSTHVDPNFATAYVGKGNTLFHLHRDEEALVAYGQALDVEPNYAPAYKGKGYVLYHLKQYKEAQRVFEQVCQLDPHIVDADMLFRTGISLAYLRRYQEAYETLEKTRQLDPSILGDADFYLFRSISLAGLKKFEEAKMDFEKVLKKVSDASAVFDSILINNYPMNQAVFIKIRWLFDWELIQEAKSTCSRILSVMPFDESVKNLRDTGQAISGEISKGVGLIRSITDDETWFRLATNHPFRYDQ